ncbi:hypothetical protein F5Y12DRAFT_793269 [Xylaria sp. FL1777]|nr:hypothetical protein F5Y12DRAFT_793269 [Xylaria sp. FL1777]
MAQTTGLSYSTLSTTWTASTSYEIVQIYTFSPGPNGVPVPYLVTEDWWTFANTIPTAVPTAVPPTVPTTLLSPATTTLATSISTTQPSPSTTSEQISHAATKSPSLSNGAVAGISIATALAGGILGVVAGLFLGRRRKRRGPIPEYVTYSDGEKELAASPITTGGLQLDQFLLDSTPDPTLANELRSLNRLVQEHTEMHYHLQPVQLESSELREPLRDLGIERDRAPAIARIASLVLEPRTRLSAIRYVITKAAFESTVIGGSACVSLLPYMAPALSQGFPISNSNGASNEATELAIARWRQLSAFLLHPNRSQRTPLEPSEDMSTQQAQKLTVALVRFLQPFISSDREERYEQENHLREVITECATFGYVIFSQPSEYRFRFESDEGLNKIVVCPGLDKLIDEDGRRYKYPLPQIVAPVLESI